MGQVVYFLSLRDKYNEKGNHLDEFDAVG